MNQKGRTPDERFIIKLLELTQEEGVEIEAKKVSSEIGLKEKATKTIVKALAQANFIKKRGDDKVCLTQRGVQFVQSELHSPS